MSSIRVDTRGIDEFVVEMGKAKHALLGRLAESGYQLLRREIRQTAYETGNLLQGVAPADIDYPIATLTVSARSGRTGSRQATVHSPNGKTKKVTLRAQRDFNYAEAVARGRAAIRPRTAKALLVPVPTAPSGESYLTVNGKIYVFRRRAAATKPNPFDDRAAAQLEAQAPRIGDAVFREFFE